MKWAGRTREGQERCGTHPFRDLVHRAGRLRDKGPEMEEGRWRRMLGEALPGLDLECLKERGKSLGCGCCGSCCRGRGGPEGDSGRAMTWCRAVEERIRAVDRMQSPAREGCKEDGGALPGTAARLVSWVGSRCRQGKEVVGDGRRGCGRQGTEIRTRRARG